MEVVSVRTQIDVPHESRIPVFRRKLHLQGKCQIVPDIRIRQIIDGAVGPGAAQSVEEHDFRSRFPAGFRHKAGPLRHAVPVKVYHDLDGRIFLQYLFHSVACVTVCIAPVQLPVDDIVNPGIVDGLYPLPV